MERITSRKNPKIQYWKKLASSASFRKEAGEYICDGLKLLEEALSGDAELTAILTAEGLPEGLTAPCPVYELPRDLLDSISPMKSPQGLLFTCRLPEAGPLPEGRRYLVLESVQDPGNVGTILRTARAMGYDALLLLPGCADLYSPKTIRAAMGALFHQPAREITYEDLEGLKQRGVTLYGAALAGNSRDLRRADFTSFGICIGSEGHGLSKRLLELCDSCLIIPMEKHCESLNAAMAAGILMWESVRGSLCLP